MAKKFTADPLADETPANHLSISLPAYIQNYAPDVLVPLAVMEGAAALCFWQQTFQPARPDEGKRRLRDSVRWPYAERLVYLAREFIRLDDRCRRYVVKAAQAGIWWRGDDIGRFQAIVAAHLEYRRLTDEDRAAYRKHLLLRARSVVNQPVA